MLYKSGREWDGCKGESGRAGGIFGGHPGRSAVWEQTKKVSSKSKNIHVFNHMFQFLFKLVKRLIFS